jgi:hypothetical protein
VTTISCAVIITRTAWRKSSTAKVPSSPRNSIRLIDARLQAESSMCMYSLHGLEPEIRPAFGLVCQRWIVSSYCTPGSPQAHAASEISRRSSAAGISPAVSPPATVLVCQSSPASTRRKKSSVSRTELFAFWNWIERQASPLRPRS